MPEDGSKLVYSTDRAIPRKGRPVEIATGALNPSCQRVVVRLDRKRRGGKSVTVIEGLSMSIKDRESLLKELKAGLGTGGTIKDSTLEIQGDHCMAVTAALANMGFRPKRSGG